MDLFYNTMAEGGAKLFVGGLSWNTDDAALQDAFGKYGNVTDAKVIMDRETNRSKGFGFVTFASRDEAEAAVSGLNGQELDGRNIRCDFAQDRDSSDRRDRDRGGRRGGPYDRPRGGRGGFGGRGRGGGFGGERRDRDDWRSSRDRDN